MARVSLFLIVSLLALSTLFVCVSTRRHRRRENNDGLEKEKVKEELKVTVHKYLTGKEEAALESVALFKIKRDFNNGILKPLTYNGDFLFDEKTPEGDSKGEPLDTEGLVVVSVGSTTTQIYDGKMSDAFAVGCGEGSDGEATKLWQAIKDGGYTKVLMTNAIGFAGLTTDPALFEFEDITSRISEQSDQKRYAGIAYLTAAFAKIFPDPEEAEEEVVKPLVVVHNRALDSNGKKKFPQLDNTFTDGLFATYPNFAAIIDWGGKSLKVWVEQKGASPTDPSKAKKIGDLSLNSNDLLCYAKKVDTELVDKLDETLILDLVRESGVTSGPVMVAQTGLAREFYLAGATMDYAKHSELLEGKTPCAFAKVEKEVFDCESVFGKD